MSVFDTIKQAIRVCLLDKNAIRKVSQDENASNFALFFLIFNIFVSTFLSLKLVRMSKLSFTQFALVYVGITILLIGSIHLLAQMFGSKTKIVYFFRPYGYSSIIFIVSLLTLFKPLELVVDIILSIWSVIITFIIIHEVYKFSKGKTATIMFLGVCIALGIILLVIVILLAIELALGFSILGLELPKGYFKEGLIPGNISLGFQTNDGVCVDKDSNEFLPFDKLCVFVSNVSGFKYNDEGLYRYVMNYNLRNEYGDIIGIEKDIFKGEEEVVLSKGLLTRYFFAPLDDLSVGKYTLQILIYDLIGSKYISLNKNFSVIPLPKDKLKVDNFTFGYYNGYYCVPLGQKVYSKDDVICLEPIVRGFEYTNNNLILFGMRLKVVDSSGKIVDYGNYFLGNEGVATNEPIFNSYVYSNLNDFNFGEYTYEVIVFDKVSRKEVNIKTSFKIDDRKPREKPAFTKNLYDVIIPQKGKVYRISGKDYDLLLWKLTPDLGTFKVNDEQFTIGKKEVHTLKNGNEFVLNHIIQNVSGLGVNVSQFMIFASD